MITLEGIARHREKKGEMETLDAVEITLEVGVQGDCRGAPGDRQVTVLSAASWKQACLQVDKELVWTDRRANLLIQGFEFLPNDVGSYLCIGDVVMEITGETDPCVRMDAVTPGLMDALMPVWRGGVCCRVLQSGTVELGDIVEIISTLE